jgi:hypothetical protein
MDMRFKCAEGFRLAEISGTEYVQDIPQWGSNSICNGFIASFPKNKTLFDCIKKIVVNCQEYFYGENALSPTGPQLLGSFVKNESHTRVTMNLFETPTGVVIKKDNKIILVTYEGYNKDKSLINPYWNLWYRKEVFGEIKIGTSDTNTKIIKLNKSYPEGWEVKIDRHQFTDKFETIIDKDILTVKRIDCTGSWGYPHTGIIRLASI